MDPDKLKQVVASVRDDHELVAEQVRTLERLEGTITGSGTDYLERALGLLREASRFFQTRLLPHLEEEEHGMFLFYRDCLPRGSTLIYELESEHEQMRKLCQRMNDELDWLRHTRHRKDAVLNDLMQVCSRLTRLLREHADREDRLLRRYLESVQAAGAEAEEPTSAPAVPFAT
jgi:hemerythrin-like domain-containing protein